MTDNKSQPQDLPAAKTPAELDDAELAQATGGTAPSFKEIVITKPIDVPSTK